MFRTTMDSKFDYDKLPRRENLNFMINLLKTNE